MIERLLFLSIVALFIGAFLWVDREVVETYEVRGCDGCYPFTNTLIIDGTEYRTSDCIYLVGRQQQPVWKVVVRENVFGHRENFARLKK